jgi:hypothetical protein
MNYLRQDKTLARFTLVWFVLSVFDDIASPLVVPISMNMVCANGGMMKFFFSDEALTFLLGLKFHSPKETPTAIT